MSKTYSIEEIFEYLWSVECDHIEAKHVDDLVKELNDIKRKFN